MDKEGMKRMLDTAYELEGLLLLALDRDEDCVRVAEMIREKVAVLSDMAVPEATKDESFTEFVSHREEEVENEEEDVKADEETTSYVIEDDEEEAPRPRPRERRPAPVFSVNDRFFYARELFGGDLNALDRALKDVASLENIEEAEDYFCTQRGFDPENPTVESFLAIVNKFFA